MAMLTQTFPMKGFGCPAGACREQDRAPARTGWASISAAFAAGVMVTSAAAILLGAAPAPKPAPLNAEQKAAAAKWVALMREQTSRELPREWRQEIKTVDFSGMYPKPR
ncbi:MAG TPA: hypothetical protein VII72_07625 [Myxococcota bacterium]|jgi:type II secretory pathway component PulK